MSQHNHKKSLLNKIDEKNEIKEDSNSPFLDRKKTNLQIQKNHQHLFNGSTHEEPFNLHPANTNNVFPVSNKHQQTIFERIQKQNDKQNILKQDFQNGYFFPSANVSNSFQQFPKYFPSPNRKITLKINFSFCE